MNSERSYLTWLAACGVGAGALVGAAGLLGVDAVPAAASQPRVIARAPQSCVGQVWVSEGGSHLCLRSAPFGISPSSRVLTPAEAARLVARSCRPVVINGSMINPPVTGLQAFRSGSTLLQVDRPCQDESATF